MILTNLFFIFSLIIIISFIVLGVFSSSALYKYLHKNSYVDYSNIAISPLSPSVSIISPAYNEEKNIVHMANSLLQLHYVNYEVIIVNDGSSDRTLELLKETFNLEKTDYVFDYKVPCARIRGIWKSTNPKYSRLIVVDKLNGGCKADASNAGLNISRNDYILHVDSDGIIERDSLTKLIKPFLDQKKKKVIAVGGVVRILNSCNVENGRISQINIPKKFIPRLQVLEYTRAFLLGRMAWSKLDGLLIISGAMGMFDKNIMLAAGGYDSKSLGEDMDVVVSMRRYMAEHKRKYEVIYIPDPLCWTEVPSTVKDLQTQRIRWTKGLIDVLRKHIKILFNPKYKNLGMLGYPFWFIFEWLAPLVAFSGIVYTLFLIVLGGINWPFFALLSAFIYSFSIFISTWALLFEEVTFHKYRNKTDVIRLLMCAFIEPFLYFGIAWFSFKANINYFEKRKWGTINRLDR